LPERILIASHAVWFYAGKLIWPVNLTFSYSRWPINAADPLAYGWLVAGAGACAAIYFARRYTGRSVEVAALFYVATLSPMLGFIMLYTFRYAFVADHYQYIASIGPIALAAAGMTRAFGSFEKRVPFLKPALGGTLLLVLGVLTWQQCGMYADLETLWRATIAKNPISWLAHNNLGYILRQKGQVDEAIVQYQKALEIDPGYANAHYNFGNALFQKGRMDEAMEHYQKALEIQPQYAEAHNNLGNVLRQKGRVDEAIIEYQKALKIDPGFAMAHYNLGMVLAQKGLADEAIIQYQKALAIQPDDADGQINLGIALFKKGRVDDAIAHFQKALEISPGNLKACHNLTHVAWVLATSPDTSARNGVKAVALVEQVEQFSRGGDPLVLDALAAAYAETGRFPEAVATARRAQHLAGDQHDSDLVNALQVQMGLYQGGAPFRDDSQTNWIRR
jgi:tetratricopeptide (TPR) repeat protein